MIIIIPRFLGAGTGTESRAACTCLALGRAVCRKQVPMWTSAVPDAGRRGDAACPGSAGVLAGNAAEPRQDVAPGGVAAYRHVT
jgi:hypothetical protein